MKAFVTGGAGFIGSHLVDRLIQDNWKVVAFDNMVFGRPANLAHHKADRSLQIVEGDIRNRDHLTRAMKGCQTVFHLAAHPNMRISLHDHQVDFDHNLTGTANVLEAMFMNRINEFVFASTSALYGEAKVIPTPEEYHGQQTSLYGASKLACEAWAEAYSEFSDMMVWSFRFGTVLGERCRRGAIHDFVQKLRKNPGELEILGDGKQAKDYLYVKDCVDGMLLGYQNAKEKVNIFNLGTNVTTLVDTVADIVIKEMGLSGVRRTYTGGPHGWIGDNPHVQLSIQKMKGLGWQTRMDAEKTISLTARWTIDNTT